MMVLILSKNYDRSKDFMRRQRLMNAHHVGRSDQMLGVLPETCLIVVLPCYGLNLNYEQRDEMDFLLNDFRFRGGSILDLRVPV